MRELYSCVSDNTTMTSTCANIASHVLCHVCYASSLESRSTYSVYPNCDTIQHSGASSFSVLLTVECL